MNERISALMDGELKRRQIRSLLSQMKSDAQFCGDWDCYHAIRDTLRGVQEPSLCARIRARLDAEPTVFAPHRRSLAGAGVAAVTVVAIVGWAMWPGSGDKSPPVPVAASESPVSALAGKDAKDYLLAHDRYAPFNGAHSLAVYLRAVAQETPRNASARSNE